jgi:hypothetical protein
MLRRSLTGLLRPRERTKTSTALAGAKPVVQASHPAGHESQQESGRKIRLPSVVRLVML